MQITISGALGHIGSHLLRTLPALLPSIRRLNLLDNLQTQRFPSLFDIGDRTGASQVEYRFSPADITTDALEPLIGGSDAVIHLAALTDAQGSVERRAAVEHNNYIGTKRLASACLNLGVPLWFPSTTSVYGAQQRRVDEYCPRAHLSPQSPYAATKLREEDCIRQLGSEGLRYAICRLGTIVGTSAGMRFHTAVNKFCWQAVLGHPLSVWRTAHDQVRPYLHIGDAARAIAFFLSSGAHYSPAPSNNANATCDVFNVVSDNLTVRQIVAMIASVTGPKWAPQVELVDSPIMNQLSYEVDNTRLTQAGFHCSHSIDDGIRATLQLLAGCNSRSLMCA